MYKPNDLAMATFPKIAINGTTKIPVFNCDIMSIVLVIELLLLLLPATIMVGNVKFGKPAGTFAIIIK